MTNLFAWGTFETCQRADDAKNKAEYNEEPS